MEGPSHTPRTSALYFKINHFYAKMSKCTFGKEEVSYLGHVISKEGVKIDNKKIKSITV